MANHSDDYKDPALSVFLSLSLSSLPLSPALSHFPSPVSLSVSRVSKGTCMLNCKYRDFFSSRRLTLLRSNCRCRSLSSLSVVVCRLSPVLLLFSFNLEQSYKRVCKPPTLGACKRIERGENESNMLKECNKEAVFAIHSKAIMIPT